MYLILTATAAHELLSSIAPLDARAKELDVMGHSLATDTDPYAKIQSMGMLDDSASLQYGIFEMFKDEFTENTK